MGVINLLSKQLANMIAAGEVVERPASVVKELLENSIDAGATDITVEIKNGGNAYIRVTDNGCGMSREDAALAFARHATSKLSREEDLTQIATMGFRGEALAAISSVSDVDLITKRECDEEAVHIHVSGGEISEPEEVGAPDGTTIVVRDLFFNTPARKKFLKKDATEGGVIVSFVEKIALAMPEIAITLIKDGRLSLQTDGRGLKSAVESVFEADTYRNLLPFSYELDGVKAQGYIGKPEIARPNRGAQYFSINGRVVRSRVFQTAVEEAMKNRLMTRVYPVCVIAVTVDFSKVDVNVHPSKLEVKLVNEKAVYDTIYFGVMSALDADRSRKEIVPPVSRAFARIEDDDYVPTQTVIAAPRVASAPTPAPTPVVPKVHNISDWGYTNVVEPKKEEQAHEKNTAGSMSTPTVDEIDRLIAQAIQARIQPVAEVEEESITAGYKYVGEIFKTYLIVECEDEVLLFDKHAAQERILFENLKAKQENPDCQSLIAPVLFKATTEQYEAAFDNIDTINQLGFDIDDFGTGSIAIRGVPADLANEDPQELLAEVVEAIVQGKRDRKPAKYDELLHSMACKAAIKGGQHNSDAELSAFVDKLMAMPDIRYCPHGRPVAITLKKSYLEGQFKR